MQIGIDFGTSYSSAAIMIGDTMKLVKDPVKHGYAFPSSIFVTEQGEILVGHAAENQRLKDLTRYRREFKRELGQDVPIVLGDRSFRVEDIITEVLKRLKTEAEYLNESPLREAVITVPAMYAHYKKGLMEKAACSAGFEVKLLEEPIAAVTYYAWQAGTNNNIPNEDIILVFDFGGGTFDAALVQKEGIHHELLAMPTGLEYCGGLDFDRKIYEDLKTRCSPELLSILETTNTKAMRSRFMVADWCQDIKHQLSETDEAEILIPIGDMENYSLTREAFNDMIEPMVLEAINLCTSLVEKAGLTWERVNQILLVGGSCRIPHIHDLLATHTGRHILRVDDPEFAVCQGAALHGMNSKDKDEKPLVSTPPRETKKGKYKSENTQIKKPHAHITLDYEVLSGVIMESLNKYDDRTYLYISPAISPKKVKNSRKTCKIPSSERILGLIDCTLFGSAKNALVFGEKQIFFHSFVFETIAGQEGSKTQIKEIADNLGYDRFPECVFREVDAQLNIGYSKKFNPDLVVGEGIIEILDDIKKQIVQMGQEKGVKKDSHENVLKEKAAILTRDHILKILKKNEDCNLFISPDIPPRKVTNANQSCLVPKGENILGILDCTFFGSAVNAMVFGEKGIYFHSDQVVYTNSYSTVTGSCTYENFLSEKFIINDGQIEFSNNVRFNTDIAEIEVLIRVLKEIRSEVERIKKKAKIGKIISILQQKITPKSGG